jgi:hypothetical protein
MLSKAQKALKLPMSPALVVQVSKDQNMRLIKGNEIVMVAETFISNAVIEDAM